MADREAARRATAAVTRSSATASIVALVTTLESEAAAGNPKLVSDLQHGHADQYRADVAYLEEHLDAITAAVV